MRATPSAIACRRPAPLVSVRAERSRCFSRGSRSRRHLLRVRIQSAFQFSRNLANGNGQPHWRCTRKSVAARHPTGKQAGKMNDYEQVRARRKSRRFSRGRAGAELLMMREPEAVQVIDKAQEKKMWQSECVQLYGTECTVLGGGRLHKQYKKGHWNVCGTIKRTNYVYQLIHHGFISSFTCFHARPNRTQGKRDRVLLA